MTVHVDTARHGHQTPGIDHPADPAVIGRDRARAFQPHARANAESIWLGIRIENKLKNFAERDDLASRLRSRFSDTREATQVE